MKEDDLPQAENCCIQRRRFVLGAGVFLTGCAEPYIFPGAGATSGPARTATLQVEGRVDVVQGGRVVAGRDGMPLFAGDEIRTFASSYAQCTFVDGDRVWLDYDTRVRMGSIFTLFGRVFASVSGIFQVDSEFVSASSEGTEYTVTIGRGNPNFSVAVKTGAVVCRPSQGRWRAIRLQAGQRLVGRGHATPREDQLDPREYDAEFGWVPAPVAVPEIRFPRRPPQRRRESPPARTDPSPPPSAPPTPSTPPKPTSPGSRGGIIERYERPPVVAPPSDPVIR